MNKKIRIIGMFSLLVFCLTGCQTVQTASPPAAWQQSQAVEKTGGEKESAAAEQAKTPEVTVPTEIQAPPPVEKTDGQKQELQLTPPKTTEESSKEAPNTKQQENTCTISINCAVIFNNLERLDPEKKELLPEGGVIFPETEVSFSPGESVFDVLLRTVKKEKIHMEFVSPPGYQSNYIEGIGNLYEFDCGELSGWVFKVNGVVPGYGSSRYPVSQGDKIEWCYTCDLGRDIGAAEGVKRP